MIITLDIETCPSQSEDLKAEFLANVKAPATYKKPESIAEWLKENAATEAEAAWRKTSFDGAYGHVCVIGLALDNNAPIAIYSDNWHADEANILRDAFDWIDSACMTQPNVRPTFVGHNLVEFDLRFLFQRAVVLGVKPSRFIPFAAKPWDDSVFDTMTRWSGLKVGGSLNKISKALGLEGKGDIDGSKVWDYVRDGRIAEVADYCKRDVAMTILTPEVRALLKRMDADDAIDKAVELALEAAAKVCEEEGSEWDSDNVITEKNYAAHCAIRIRALKEQK